MPKIYSKNCEFCGLFYKKAAKRFCSLKCSSNYSSLNPNSGCFVKGHRLNVKPDVFRVCPNCKLTFKVQKNNPGTKYCCHNCSTEHMFKGKRLTEEHKNKISLHNARYWSGRKMSPEHIKKMTTGLKKYQSGENHWNWKGGITSRLKTWRYKSEYSKWRKAVFERDNYTCQMCKQRGGKLNVDHIIPWAKIINEKLDDIIWKIDNGRTLCVECHRKTDSYAKRFTKNKKK